MSDVKKVWDWIDSHKDEAVTLLQDMVRVPSVNPKLRIDEVKVGEGDFQRFLADYYKKMGVDSTFTYPDAEKLKRYEGKAGYYADHTFEDRPNLYAEIKGTGGGKSIMLSGHTDVVSGAGDNWDDEPFSGALKDGKVFGRGTVDMKGGIGAFTTAIKAIKECGIELSGDIKVGTVVDEEAGGMGTLALVEEGYRADACIVCEPTDLKIAPLCRGILWGKIIVPARAGHIEHKPAFWREGGSVDAIDKMRYILKAIENKNKEWAVTKTHKLIPIPCQIKIAQVDAGNYASSYAGEGTIVFDAQYLPSEMDENRQGSKVKEEITKFLDDVAQTDFWMRENPPYIEWIVDADCAEVPEGHPFMNSLCDILKTYDIDAEMEGLGCHTDIGFFDEVGIPTINFGPGEVCLCHQANEHVKVEDYIKAAKILAAIIINWCK